VGGALASPRRGVTFGANPGSIDLIRVPSITPSNVTFA